MQSGKICGGLGLRACKAAQDELRLYTLEEMEQAIRRGSRGRKPAKAVNIDEGEEPPSRAGRSATYMDVEPAANEICGDIRLEIRERQDEVGPQREDLLRSRRLGEGIGIEEMGVSM